MKEREYGKDRIVKAASDLFEQKGVDNVDIKLLAEYLDSEEQGILNLFSGMDEINKEVLYDKAMSLVKEIKNLGRSTKYLDKNGIDQLKDIFLSELKCVFYNWDDVRVMKDLLTLYGDDLKEKTEIYNEYCETIDELLQKAIEKSMSERSDRCEGSKYDLLTGLLSKKAFMDGVREILDNNPDIKYELLVCDIEKFKLLNDKYGIQEGDGVLKYVGKRIKMLELSNDSLATRSNADRFFVFFRHEEGKVNRIVSEATENIRSKFAAFNITLKFGVYIITDKTLPVNFMCDRAELAVNSIKGKYNISCVYYEDSLRKKMITEQLIVTDMETALREEQFEVYFQPKIDLLNDRMAGAEALVRWNHPKRGFISPGDFIPVFEKNGFVTKLDMYVWEKTCQYIREWKNKLGKMVPVSVNVSRLDLYMPRLVETFLSLIERYSLDVKDLHLEITESAYSEDADKLLEVVGQLKEKGFVIEMDDFGSGYSSLNMLSDMPIDILKLDMRFIQSNDLGNNRNIVNFVTGLAKWMNLLVVAEGVETQEQINVLKALECNYVQGFFYSRPLQAKVFEEYMIETNEVSADDTEVYSDKYGELYVKKGNSEKVLLVVDNVLWNCKLICEYFKDTYTVAFTENATVAWNYVQDNAMNIELAIVDLNVSGISGMELIVNMRKNKESGLIPVIATSQFGQGGEEMALTLGASDFVQKPYGRGVIVRRVQSVLMSNGKYNCNDEVVEKTLLDPATGFYNQKGMESQVFLFSKKEGPKDAVFIVIDIDDFKSISEKKGYSTGGNIIKKIVEVLKGSFRREEFISHSGGDEFCVFLEGKFTEESLKNRMDKLIDDLVVEMDGAYVTSSIGVCRCDEKNNNYTVLYNKSKKALKTAKAQGKNCYVIEK